MAVDKGVQVQIPLLLYIATLDLREETVIFMPRSLFSIIDLSTYRLVLRILESSLDVDRRPPADTGASHRGFFASGWSGYRPKSQDKAGFYCEIGWARRVIGCPAQSVVQVVVGR